MPLTTACQPKLDAVKFVRDDVPPAEYTAKVLGSVDSRFGASGRGTSEKRTAGRVGLKPSSLCRGADLSPNVLTLSMSLSSLEFNLNRKDL